MTNKELGHRPVLIEEVIEQLGPKDNETYIDATFGYGGYTERILQSCECKVIAIDRDPAVKKQAERFKKKFGSRFSFAKENRLPNFFLNLSACFLTAGSLSIAMTLHSQL